MATVRIIVVIVDKKILYNVTLFGFSKIMINNL